jgi:riboflavin synthase
VFTGLIQEIGLVREARRMVGGRRFAIECGCAGSGLQTGESIACDGVCLTVEAVEPERGAFRAAAVEATLRRTTAGEWRVGRRLHLERALEAGARVGGHWVQGHVDGTVRVVRAGPRVGGHELWLRLPPALQRFVVPRGSLAVDGVSLTVAALRGGACGMVLVPETLARTHLGALRPGDRVNLEVDVLAKHLDALRARPRVAGRG